VRFLEDGKPLGEERVVGTRVSLPSDRSFKSWDTALAHVTGPPLPDDTDLVPGQAVLDVLMELPITSTDSRFSMEPSWAHLGIRTSTVLRFLPPGGGERAFQYVGNPGLVRLDPRWYQAVLRFVRMGFFHILGGLDHLLFLLCLIIPLRRLSGLVPVVTAFTVAHSITLVASAAGFAPTALWFPSLVETLIAVSILWMALENIVGARLERRWLAAFGFGLVHGFGFSFVLRDTMQFAGSHLASSLLAFNVGVELGQLAVVLATIPVLEWLFRRVVAERMGTIILSALVAHTAWHWMTARGGQLLQYDFRWPAMDPGLAAAAMRWAMLALVAAGAVWMLYGVFGWWGRWVRRGEAVADVGG
ncbi:MAG TPA: HupE/UreJ family protein, partial [Longimicrobiales bacterium]|nr:HupE/UreJ family protein [Longimicrobiales bacterium]